MTTHLIVDDSKTIRLTVRKALEALTIDDLRVVEAEDAKSAVQKFRAAKPDLTFLDIELGEKGGDEVLRELLAERPEARIVLLTSADPDDKRVRDALSQGAFAFMPKPVRRDEIARIIAAVEHESRPTRKIL